MLALVRRRVLLMALVIVSALGLFLSSQGGSTAYATGNDLWEDGYACYVSGQHRDTDMVNRGEQRGVTGFGQDRHYTLERDDLFALLGDQYRDVTQTEGNWSYFNRGLPQAVDWLYAMYPEDFRFTASGTDNYPSLDDHVYDFFLWTGGDALWSDVCSRAGGDCHLGPNRGNREIKTLRGNSGDKLWDNIGEYLDLRAVARYYEEPVRRFAAGWYDPRAPEGGLRVNEEAVGAASMGRLKALDEATRRGVVEGHRLITGTNDVPYVLVNGTFGTTCTGGTSVCTVNSNFTSQVQQATVSEVKVDHSNNEQHQGDVDDQLPVGVHGGGRGGGSGDGLSYAALGQEDTEENLIFVTIRLDDDRRSDFQFETSGEDGGRVGLWAFGKQPWTYAHYRGHRGPDSAVWLHYRDVDLAGVEVAGYDNFRPDRAHYGYRQPTMGSAFTRWDEDDVGGSGYQGFCIGSGCGARALYESIGQGAGTSVRRRFTSNEELYKEWRRVRWPVNFEDLNWYLYELPGGDFYDPLTLFWLSAEGVSGLVGSAYLRHRVSDWGGFSGPGRVLECGFPDENGDLLFGTELHGRLSDVGVAGHVQCDQQSLDAIQWAGASTLPGVDLTKWDREEIEGVGYRDNVGFFPFQVNVPQGNSFGEFSQAFGEDQFPLDKQAVDGLAFPQGGEWHSRIHSRLIPAGSSAGSRADDAQGELVLVKAGVERPVDADGPVGTRTLSRFDFVIDEAEQFASHSIHQLDEEGRKRFGFPLWVDLVERYAVEWPFQPISPNRPYLLVFTFYEMVQDGHIEFEVNNPDPDNKFHSEKLKVPERHIRRVVCRAVILPSGYGPVVPEGGWWGAFKGYVGAAASTVNEHLVQPVAGVVEGVVDVGKGVVSAIGGAIDFLANPGEWVSGILFSFALIPKEGAERGVGLACDSADVVDEYMEPDGARAEPATLVTDDGTLVENPGVVAQRDFDDDCLEEGASLAGGVGGRDGVICAPSEGVGAETCADLPRLSLYLDGERYLQDGGGRAAVATDYEPQWLNPSARVNFDNLQVDAAFEGPGDFDFLPAITEDEMVTRGDGVAPGAYNMGLLRVRVGIDNLWTNAPDEVTDGIDGFVVEVKPDPRAWDGEQQGVLGDRRPMFYLPAGVMVYPGGAASATGRRIHLQTDGFYFGTLERSSLYEGFDQVACELPGGLLPGIGCLMSLGAVGTQDQLDKFIYFLDQLPVAPTFEHSFRVRAFRGEGPPGERVVGPWSEWLVVGGLSGSVCGAVPAPGVPGVPDYIKWGYGCYGVPTPVGADPYDNRGQYGRVLDPEPDVISPVAASTLSSIAGFRVSLPLAQVGGHSGLVGDSELRVGLLDLSGTSICGDLFSSTPSSLTWDNKAVQYGWRMNWVLAGAVLFVLAVWGGLRMTYDTWLVGRVSAAVRDMLPRFLIALLLAAGSLMLCRLVIILFADMTCFIAHSTGMTFWGVIGNSFVNVMKGFGQVFTNSIAETVVAGSLAIAVLLKFKLFVLLVFFVFWIAVILVMMFKVSYYMLMRIALIAVCIVFSPLAFALYASPDTAHWTGKWLRLFFGALAQQAVTLVVLYVGASFIRGVDAEGFGDWGELLMASFLAIAMFALAIRVPRIINPDGEGFFNEFSGLLRMGAAAAMFVASAVGGGISGVMGGPAQVTTAPGGGGATPPSAPGGLPPSPAPGGPGGAGGQGRGPGGGPGVGGQGGVGGGVGGFVGAGMSWFNRVGSNVGDAVRMGSRQATAGYGGREGGGGGVISRFAYGMGEGARRGARMNNLMNNIGQGNFMFRNMGVGDDAANRIQDMQRQISGLQPAPDDGSANPAPPRARGPRPRPRRSRFGP